MSNEAWQKHHQREMRRLTLQAIFGLGIAVVAFSTLLWLYWTSFAWKWFS